MYLIKIYTLPIYVNSLDKVWTFIGSFHQMFTYEIATSFISIYTRGLQATSFIWKKFPSNKQVWEKQSYNYYKACLKIVITILRTWRCPSFKQTSISNSREWFAPNLNETSTMVLERRFLHNDNFFRHFAIISPWWRRGPSFEQTSIPIWPKNPGEEKN